MSSRYTLALVIGIFWGFFPSPAPAQGKPPRADKKAEEKEKEEKARGLFEEAEAHYNIGEYEVALEGYKEAYLLSKKPALLFNMGQCYRKLERYEEALTTYRSYLREVPNSPIREEVEQHIAEAEGKLAEKSYARVVITSSPPGAQIHRGGPSATVIGETPLTIEKLEAGEYHFTLTLEGYEPWAIDLNAQGGREYIIPEVKLLPVGSEAPSSRTGREGELTPDDVIPADPDSPFVNQKRYLGVEGIPAAFVSVAGNASKAMPGLGVSYVWLRPTKRTNIGIRATLAGNGDDAMLTLGVPFRWRKSFQKWKRLRLEPTVEAGLMGLRLNEDLGGVFAQIRPDFLFHLGGKNLLLVRPVAVSVVALSRGNSNPEGGIHLDFLSFGYARMF